MAEDPGDPRTWLQFAHQDLALAKASVPGVGYGLLCFHAQQAAEKAIKAVLLAGEIPFPYIHDLGRLLTLAGTAGIEVPTTVEEADLLTDYSTISRYPGVADVDVDAHSQAIAIAQAVVAWAESEIVGRSS